jgi:hypothetical protein
MEQAKIVQGNIDKLSGLDAIQRMFPGPQELCRQADFLAGLQSTIQGPGETIRTAMQAIDAQLTLAASLGNFPMTPGIWDSATRTGVIEAARTFSDPEPSDSLDAELFCLPPVIEHDCPAEALGAENAALRAENVALRRQVLHLKQRLDKRDAFRNLVDYPEPDVPPDDSRFWTD